MATRKKDSPAPGSRKKSRNKASSGSPAADPIHVWLVALKREHYDDVPRDWPEQLIEELPALVVRPRPKGQTVLPRPVSIEILGPQSLAKILKTKLGRKFTVKVLSDGT